METVIARTEKGHCGGRCEGGVREWGLWGGGPVGGGVRKGRPLPSASLHWPLYHVKVSSQEKDNPSRGERRVSSFSNAGNSSLDLGYKLPLGGISRFQESPSPFFSSGRLKTQRPPSEAPQPELPQTASALQTMFS